MYESQTVITDGQKSYTPFKSHFLQIKYQG